MTEVHLQDNLKKNFRGDNSLLGERQFTWWTGKRPQAGECPGVNQQGILHSINLPDLTTCTRDDLLNYFHNSWALTETLFSALQGEEAFYRIPIHQLRHPLIFYYCHPAVLYINKLRVASLMPQAIDPYFEQLFETGVDEMSWDDLSKNHREWPSVAEVTKYRAKAYQAIKEIITNHPALDHLPITQNHPGWALLMGFEHERIHLETSSVLIRELPPRLVKKPKEWPAYYALNLNPIDQPSVGQDYPDNVLIPVSSRQVQIGKPETWPSYGWDNEYGEQQIEVQTFRASQSLISNGEFLQFVQSGAYHEERFWSTEGWQWRSFRNAKWPTFWVPKGPAGLHQYNLRLCFDVVVMQWDWPVNVNYHEAKAYCAWRTEQDKTSVSYRVLTEAEHHCLRTTSSSADANNNLLYGSECSVNRAQTASHPFNDVFGNVWEWCEDHFAPLTHFKTHPFYVDFSTPCFDDKHNMIMGGSFISTGDEASPWARFHFRRHFHQHAGFRLVQSSPLEESEPELKNVYETDKLLNQYLLLHYGSYEATFPYSFLGKEVIGFPERCGELLISMAKQYHVTPNRALDLGCAVGGSTFALARHFAKVTGIDFSANFIAAANELKHQTKTFYYQEEGLLRNTAEACVDAAIDKNRCEFLVGDACDLPQDLGEFDVVLLANLLCRLANPRLCLDRMSGHLGLVKPGGLMLITSPYSWLEAYTPEAAWFGGKQEAGGDQRSSMGLQQILTSQFELLHETNMPLIIREHARKFEYIVAHATVWRRRK